MDLLPHILVVGCIPNQQLLQQQLALAFLLSEIFIDPIGEEFAVDCSVFFLHGILEG
jgi:hypothetical protein